MTQQRLGIPRASLQNKAEIVVRGIPLLGLIVDDAAQGRGLYGIRMNRRTWLRSDSAP